MRTFLGIITSFIKDFSDLRRFHLVQDKLIDNAKWGYHDI